MDALLAFKAQWQAQQAVEQKQQEVQQRKPRRPKKDQDALHAAEKNKGLKPGRSCFWKCCAPIEYEGECGSDSDG